MTQCARTNFASSLGTTGCLFNLELLDNSRAIGGTTCGENMSKYALFPWMYPLPGWRGIDSTPWGIAAALGPDPPNICRYCVEFQKRTGDGIAFNRAFRQAKRTKFRSCIQTVAMSCGPDHIHVMWSLQKSEVNLWDKSWRQWSFWTLTSPWNRPLRCRDPMRHGHWSQNGSVITCYKPFVNGIIPYNSIIMYNTQFHQSHFVIIWWFLRK